MTPETPVERVDDETFVALALSGQMPERRVAQEVLRRNRERRAE